MLKVGYKLNVSQVCALFALKKKKKGNSILCVCSIWIVNNDISKLLTNTAAI